MLRRMTAPGSGPVLRTTSLRLQVSVAVLALLTVLLVALGVLVNLRLGEQLRADLTQRLVDRAGYARVLAEQGLDAQTLADQLTGADIAATYVVDGSTVYGRVKPAPAPKGTPKSPAAPKASAAGGDAVQQSGEDLSVTQSLAGGTLTLTTSQVGVEQTLGLLRAIEVVGGLVMLAVTGLLLIRVVGVALRPLDRMTALATGITRGDRGARLRPASPRTELGRTATAFDDMLDALEDAEGAAQSSAAAAAAAEERMRQFLADASHELRTPVAGLQAGAETLLRDNPGRAQREQLAYGMVRETRRAARLVEDLLLMTRLEGPPGADRTLLRRERVDMAVLAARVVGDQRRLASDVLLDVHTDGQHERAAVVDGDPGRLTQVLTNLLDNARHVTPPGGRITVSVQRIDGAGEGDDDVVQVHVDDTGPGVPAGDRDRIFDRFVRLDQARSRAHGGSGLGLPIARAIAAAHRGTLTCLPSTAGACFRLTLPAGPPPPRPASEADEQVSGVVHGGPHQAQLGPQPSGPARV